MMASARDRGALWKGGTSASTTGECIMTRHVNDGRRLPVGVLLGIILVIWGSRQAMADDSANAAAKSAAGYVEESFANNGNQIRVQRFDPKDKRPAVLILYGADGGVGVEKLYRGLAQRMADKGYVVFIVHYLDSTSPEPPAEISKLVKRAVRGNVSKCEEVKVRKYFDTWTGCVTDAVGHIREQPGVDGERVGIVGLSLGGFVGLSCAAQKNLNIAAVVSGFGGLRKDQRDSVKWLPPTLAVGGEKDEVIPIAELNALKDLADSKKLPITVKIYPTGHVFEIAKGKYDWWSMVDAERLTMDHFEKYLLAPKGRAQGK
jgi:dienelactone hydrolase